MKKLILFAAMLTLVTVSIQAEDFKEIRWNADNIESVILMLERPAYGDSTEIMIKFRKPVQKLEGLLFRYRHGELAAPNDYSNICEQIKNGTITGAIYEETGGDRFTGLPKVTKLKNIRGFIY